MLLSTPEGKVLEVNQAFVATMGYSLGMLAAEEGALASLCADPHAYEAAISKLEQGIGLRGHELQLRTHDGLLLDCLISAEPVVIHDQRCVLGVIQDITERKRNETELMAAIEAVMKDTSWFSQTVIEKRSEEHTSDLQSLMRISYAAFCLKKK